MITIGLPQEQITLKTITPEQAGLFGLAENWLNIGVFVRGRFYGLVSFSAYEGYLWLNYCHVFYMNFPYVIRRMSKYVKSFAKATKKKALLFSQDLDWFNTNPRGFGGLFFKNYGEISEVFRDKKKVVFMVKENDYAI